MSLFVYVLYLNFIFMLPLLAAALPSLITAGASIGSGLLAQRAQRKQNRFQREMWQEQNVYNLPVNQRQRLREAGLNPALIYGSGGGQTQAGPPPMPEVLPLSIPNMLGAYQDFKLKQAQTDNVRASTELAIARESHEWIRRDVSEQTRHKMDLESQRLFKLMPFQLDAARLGVERQRETITGIDLDNIFKRYRNDWMRAGFTSSDSVIFRFMVRWLQEAGMSPTQYFEQMSGADKFVPGP